MVRTVMNLYGEGDYPRVQSWSQEKGIQIWQLCLYGTRLQTTPPGARAMTSSTRSAALWASPATGCTHSTATQTTLLPTTSSLRWTPQRPSQRVTSFVRLWGNWEWS